MALINFVRTNLATCQNCTYKLSNLPNLYALWNFWQLSILYVQIWHLAKFVRVQILKLPKLTINFNAQPNFGNFQICTRTILARCQICTYKFWHVAKFVRTNFGVAKIRTGFKICSKFWQLQNLYHIFGTLPNLYTYIFGNLPKMYASSKTL